MAVVVGGVEARWRVDLVIVNVSGWSQAGVRRGPPSDWRAAGRVPAGNPSGRQAHTSLSHNATQAGWGMGDSQGFIKGSFRGTTHTSDNATLTVWYGWIQYFVMGFEQG